VDFGGIFSHGVRSADAEEEKSFSTHLSTQKKGYFHNNYYVDVSESLEIDEFACFD
jgi:hypothetical protein